MTDRFVANAKADATGRTDFFDEVTRGLVLRVSARGRKSWAFFHTSPRDGKRARLTLGTYPGTSLAAARGLAVEAAGQVGEGRDPRAQRAVDRAGAMTVRTLIASYVEGHALPNLRSGNEVKRRLMKNAASIIGDVAIAALHRRDIARVTDAILRRGRPVEAGRVFEDLRGMLRWAMARGDLDHNPTDGMQKPAGNAPRERVLDEDEVRNLWASLPSALAKSKDCQRIIKLCLITGQRVGEVAGMARSELDLKGRLWSLPGSRTKNGHPHTVPLSDSALDVIEEAIAEAGQGAAFVFPAAEGSLSAHAVARTILRANQQDDRRPLGRFGIAPWSAHDLRRTALTGMARLGIAPIVLGHVANHRSTTRAGVTLAVYARYTYDAEKRAALDLWAERLQAIVSGDAGAVVPLRIAQ